MVSKLRIICKQTVGGFVCSVGGDRTNPPNERHRDQVLGTSLHVVAGAGKASGYCRQTRLEFHHQTCIPATLGGR